MKALFVLLLSLAGLAAGATAGHLMRPPGDGEKVAGADSVAGGRPAEEPRTAASDAETSAAEMRGDQEPHEFARLDKQFVVPVVANDRIGSVVALTLAVQVREGATDYVHANEPKLRDLFLQKLFLHAQSGGFDEDFMDARILRELRDALRGAARDVIGSAAQDVLILELMRQDMS